MKKQTSITALFDSSKSEDKWEISLKYNEDPEGFEIPKNKILGPGLMEKLNSQNMISYSSSASMDMLEASILTLIGNQKRKKFKYGNNTAATGIN